MGTGKSKMERDAAELRSMQAASRERQGVSPTTGATSAVVDKTDADNAMKNFKPRDMSKNPLKKESYDAYDLVLEYILSQGHAETIAEAHYVMMEMDSEMIGDIVEGSISSKAANAVGHQRAGTLGDDDEMRKNQDATSASIGRMKRGSGAKVTPTLPGV
jgi:hypothetical protein